MKRRVHAYLTAMGMEAKRLRKAAGLTQRDAAALIGVTRQTYQRWESALRSGLRRSDLRELARWAGEQAIVPRKSA